MSNLPVNRDQFITPSVSIAEADERAMRGGFFRLESDKDYYLRFMPAFTSRNGEGVWYSISKKHYKIPNANTDSGFLYMCCPRVIGERCLVCENQHVYEDMNLWEGRDGCRPKPRVLFNVIDRQNPAAGVLVLDDTITLWRLLRAKLKRYPNLFNPFDGQTLLISTSRNQPWRDVDLMEDGKESLENIVGSDKVYEWALPENLPNLDDMWTYYDLDRQRELLGGNPGEPVKSTIVTSGSVTHSDSSEFDKDDVDTEELEDVNDILAQLEDN